MEYASKEDWEKKGRELFGDDQTLWQFQCPMCKNVMTPGDFKKYKDQGATPNSAYQECVGRYTGGRKGPNKCDWAAYGLFRGPDCVEHENGETWVFPFNEGAKSVTN